MRIQIGRVQKTVPLRSESRTEDTGLGVISIQVVSNAVGEVDIAQAESGELDKQGD